MDRKSKIKSSLQHLEPDEFERFVASVWSEMGWSTAVTQKSRDQGIDIIAEKSGIYNEKAVIQAKCYGSGSKVSRPDIQQYSTLKEQVTNADTVIIVTSSNFTSEAISLSNQLNVKTVCGDELVQASIEYLPKPQLDNVMQQSHFERQTEGDSVSRTSVEDIPTENLTQSEQDLAKIYKGYFQRYVKDGKENNEQMRRLIFQMNNIEELQQKEYLILGQVHHIGLYPEDTTLLSRLQQTAKKYGWEIGESRVERTDRAGFDISKIKDRQSTYSMVINTGTTAGPVDPERQAKITSLLFSSIFDEDLSGTKIKEATSFYTSSSPTTEIE